MTSGPTVPDRLGVAVPAAALQDIDALISLAKLAESLGYESLWIPETWGFDSISVIAMLAAATSTIKLATGVLNVFSRSASLIAQTAASLQTISGGRFILGLGASGPLVVERWHGVPYHRPIQRTREYIEVIHSALRGERVDHDGQLLRLHGFSLGVSAVRTDIYLAALGARNIRLAGEMGDGWLPIFVARGHVAQLLEYLHEGARATGRHPENIDIAAYIPTLTGTRAEQLLRAQLAYYLGGMGTFYREFVRRTGFAREAGEIEDRWESGDRAGAARAVSDRLLTSCTAGATSGSAESHLQTFRSEGIGLPIVALPHGCTAEEAAQTLKQCVPTQTPDAEGGTPTYNST